MKPFIPDQPASEARWQISTLRTNDINVDVTPDGQRFLFAEAAPQAGSQSLMIVTDWLRASAQTSNSK